MYIKNRTSVTHLHPYGVLLTLMPNARKEVSDSPGIRQAIKDGLIIETRPIKSETQEIVGWHDVLSVGVINAPLGIVDWRLAIGD